MRKALFIIIICFLIAVNLPAMGQVVESIASAEEQPLKLALIWWVDTVDLTELQVINRSVYRAEYMRKTKEIVKQKLISRFSGPSYILMTDTISDALSNNGYDINAFDMPDKVSIIRIAQDAGADAILVFELSCFGLQYPSNTQLQYYTVSRYRAYNARNNQYKARRSLYEGDNFRSKAFEGKDDIFNRLEGVIENTLDNLLTELPF